MLPLFLIIFIDSMGLGIIFPILNGLIMMPDSNFIAHTTILTTRQEYFGMIVGIFMLCWFFGAAILGELSDNIGRKKSLLICLAGSFLGYLLSAFAVIADSFALLIIGRVIAGFTSGSQPIAQASIVDISNEKNLPRNMGYILLCVSLGFVFGPVIAGILSNPSIISWFAFSTPLYFAAAISLINAILLWFMYHESYQVSGKIKISLTNAVVIFISAFKHKKVGVLSMIFLTMLTGWQFFFNYFLLFLDAKYHINNFEGSIFMFGLGIGFAIGCAYLTNKLSSLFALKNIICAGLMICAAASLLMTFNINIILTWLLVLIVGANLIYSYSSMLVLFSQMVTAKEQGWVMGITGAMLALTNGIAAFLAPAVARLGLNYPLFFAAITFMLSSIWIVTRKNTVRT